MQNKKKVYDSDNLILEVSEKLNKTEEISAVNTSETVNMTTEQAIDVLAGYSLPRLELVEQGVGECIICGIETNSPMRCICFDCMKKHGLSIYRKAKEATKKAKKSFII